ncbi:methylmalonyl-CoA mutase family protein [Bacillus massiliigorillae]|uniref:methylmalonyl-CoA mutase family protein n=1 Tax=Bacillus massiliigorillae TaxID=1243664 RepID=UPI0003A0CF66|nr:methylmalonyl-CoA mutase family protein [Bacillus massiliigorillae]
MDLQKTKAVEFPKVTVAEWEVKAEKSLKGKPLAKLHTSTYEGIELTPLYTNQSTVIKEEWPGFAPYTRGTSALGYQEKPWLISQKLSGHSSTNILADFEEAKSRGQNTVALDASQLTSMSEEELVKFVEEVIKQNQPLFVDTKGEQQQIVSKLKALSSDELVKLQGVLAEDPIAEGAIQGKGIENPKEYFATWFEKLQSMDSAMPEVKKILVKSTSVHNAGGNAVQELAFALATAVEYLQHGEENGYTAEKMSKNVVFSFAIDSSFFMNVAKLRAARRLWSLIGEEYTGDASTFKMFIHSETSSFTATLFDPYVNLLRAANQAFAAVVGGAQSLEVKEFDSATNETTAFSERIARNIHLVLKEETLIDKVVDPAGGSYYVETLTNELADQAWNLFLEIEKRGGVIASLRDGWIQEAISQVLQQKKTNVAKRKDSLIGTNVYPNLEDTVNVHERALETEQNTVPFNSVDIAPLTAVRLAEEFEQLRIASLQYKEQKGAYPAVGLVCLGSLKSYKPRADFVKGFFAAGGVEGIMKPCESPEVAKAYIAESKVKHIVLCGSDADYEENAVAWVQALEESGVSIFLAGKQSQELANALQQAGLKDFISVQSNAIEVITNVLKDLEVM